MVGERLLVLALLAGCKLGPAGRIAHDANKDAHAGEPYSYSADGLVHVSRTPSDSFWFSPCGDDSTSGFAVDREGNVTFTPKEARVYNLCIELRTAAGVDDTYRFEVVARGSPPR